MKFLDSVVCHYVADILYVHLNKLINGLHLMFSSLDVVINSVFSVCQVLLLAGGIADPCSFSKGTEGYSFYF